MHFLLSHETNSAEYLDIYVADLDKNLCAGVFRPATYACKISLMSITLKLVCQKKRQDFWNTLYVPLCFPLAPFTYNSLIYHQKGFQWHQKQPKPYRFFALKQHWKLLLLKVNKS